MEQKKFANNSKSRAFLSFPFHFLRKHTKNVSFSFELRPAALLIPFVHLFLFYVLRSFRSANKL